MLKGKRILVGITGGIAAYKAPDLVSKLVKLGANVHVLMTASAENFVTPLTLQTISRNPVSIDMFHQTEQGVKHIELADMADLFIVVPATANIIGKVRSGIADDIVTTVIMATTAKVMFAPAMNVHMYENPIVQDNISYLKEKGYLFIEPDTGHLACGYTGKGRLPEIDLILNEVLHCIENEKGKLDLQGKRVLITAGPTREYLDPVRYLTNGSTGKMGYAVAEEVVRRGGQAVLISGPVNLDVPQGVTYVPIESAQEMFEAVKRCYQEADIIVKTAAVADYRPVEYSSKKIKKGNENIELKMERNPDILKFLGDNKENRILVGFAAETDSLIDHASDKMERKNLDFIVANDITIEGAGFGADTNIVKIIHKDGRIEELPIMSKREVAESILDRVTVLLNYI